MKVLVDSSVLLDVIARDSRWAAWSEAKLVHRVISRRHTVAFKRVWMRGVSEEHIRCDT
jgi:hypothetical protein